jgi:hypothetical protein
MGHDHIIVIIAQVRGNQFLKLPEIIIVKIKINAHIGIEFADKCVVKYFFIMGKPVDQHKYTDGIGNVLVGDKESFSLPGADNSPFP